MPKELVDVLTEELPDDEDGENEKDSEIFSYIDEIYDTEKRYPQVMSFQFQ